VTSAATPANPAPVATEAQVRRLAQDWLRKARDGQVLAIDARPQWNGAPTLDIGGQSVRVVACPSPLAVRAAIVDQAADERLVVLTDCDADELGVGLLAHCAKLRPVSIEAWELVRTQFGVVDLDPSLVKEGSWLAEAVIENAPAGGWPPASGTVLTRGHALRSLSAALLGMGAGDLDSAGVLQWSTRSVEVVRYAALPAGLRAGVAAWLSETAGAPARWTMACVNVGNGTDAIPLGLLARLLWAPDLAASAAVAAARVRMESLIGGAQPSLADAQVWGEAAQAWVERVVDGGDQPLLVTRVLGRAEEIARSVQAEALLTRSDLLPAALDARLHAFADRLRAALAKPNAAALADVENALRELRRHRLSGVGSRVGLAEMATRLLRWLAGPDPAAPATLAAAVARQVQQDGWVDRARLDVWAGDPDPYVAAAYQLLHAAVDARRREHDQQFAGLLAAATNANSAPGQMIQVEDVLARVVRPILDAGQRVLLLVVDGMSVAASTELVESISGWIELTLSGGPRVGVLAALPTVTQVSRASLFAGKITVGQQAEERAGLAAAIGTDMRLLHKAELRAGPGASLDPTVIDALGDPSIRLVAAVVNTIDDALSADPGTTEWTVHTVRAVGDLLAHAKDRVVVLLSDHGHILDRGEEAQLRTDPSGGSRWRSATAPAGDGEVLVAGQRVALSNGRAVLAWQETLRYAPRKAGYHGGASPAEAVIPLTILSAVDDTVVPGWSGAPVAAPAWWRGPVAVETISAVARIPVAADTLFDVEPVPAPVAPTGQPSEVVAALLASPIYRSRQKLAGRATLPDSRVAAVVSVLIEAGGRARVDSVAAAAGIPAHRIHLTIAALRRLLQVEGYPVLDVDPDGQTLLLDERLLREQFQLGS
jgi:hypothetical protein